MERKDLEPITRQVETYFGVYEEEAVYDKSEADSVMDDLEAQIRNLNNANAELIKRVQALEEECNELEAAISKMETTEPKWISVKDRLPKEGKEVIVFYTCWKHEYQQVAMFESGEFIDLGGCALSPTHWQPLPPPPTTEEK